MPATAKVYDEFGNELFELDDDDVVPPGATLRVPMPLAFRDALSDAARRVFERDDDASPRVTDIPALLKALRQGERDRGADLALHRAGPRFGDATTRQRREDAYREMIDRQTSRWRSPPPTAVAAGHGQWVMGHKGADDSGGKDYRPAAQTSRAAAYAERNQRLVNAWRSPR